MLDNTGFSDRGGRGANMSACVCPLSCFDISLTSRCHHAPCQPIVSGSHDAQQQSFSSLSSRRPFTSAQTTLSVFSVSVRWNPHELIGSSLTESRPHQLPERSAPGSTHVRLAGACSSCPADSQPRSARVRRLSSFPSVFA